MAPFTTETRQERIFSIEPAPEEPASAPEPQNSTVLNPEVPLFQSVNNPAAIAQQEDPSNERQILSPVRFEALQTDQASLAAPIASANGDEQSMRAVTIRSRHMSGSNTDSKGQNNIDWLLDNVSKKKLDC